MQYKKYMIMEEIISSLYVKLKKDSTQIYKVSSIDNESHIVVATQKDNSKIVLNLSDIENASDDDMLKYESDIREEYYP